MANRGELKRQRKQKAIAKLWYPKASDLQLPEVPADNREQVRARLEPVLARLSSVESIMDGDSVSRLSIKASDCWNVSQSLVLTAKDPDILYVEGAWDFVEKDRYASAAPHGWNLVDGYVVDLSRELYLRQGHAYSVEREPLRQFTHEEVSELLGDFGDWAPLMDILWAREHIDDIGKSEDEAQSFHDAAFSPVVTQLTARLETSDKVKIRPDASLVTVCRVPEHEAGTPTCILHTAFDEAGFQITTCPCCDKAGYLKPDHASVMWAIEHLQQVARVIKDVKGLRENHLQLQKFIRERLREKDMPLYQPKAFAFIVTYEPAELHKNCRSQGGPGGPCDTEESCHAEARTELIESGK